MGIELDGSAYSLHQFRVENKGENSVEITISEDVVGPLKVNTNLSVGGDKKTRLSLINKVPQ